MPSGNQTSSRKMDTKSNKAEAKPSEKPGSHQKQVLKRVVQKELKGWSSLVLLIFIVKETIEFIIMI